MPVRMSVTAMPVVVHVPVIVTMRMPTAAASWRRRRQPPRLPSSLVAPRGRGGRERYVARGAAATAESTIFRRQRFGGGWRGRRL